MLISPIRGLAVPVALAGSLLGVAACSRTEPAKDTSPAGYAPPAGAPKSALPPDGHITTLIQAKYYADDTIRSRDVAVDVQNGNVTLRGTVPDEGAKQRAVALARSVEGVRSVEDALQVRAASTAATGRDRDSGAAEVGTTGQVQPWWITTKIQAQYFANSEIRPWNIDVTTQNGGVVTLEGVVDSEQDKNEALRIARATEGVTRVDDGLRVDSAASRGPTGGGTASGIEPPDAWLTAKIQAKYFVDADVKGRRIDVDTRGGVATLTGTVGGAAERRQAVALARNTDGIRDVKDELRVDASTDARGTDARGAQRTGSRLERPDAWITTKVQASYFLNPDVKGHQINVDTDRGVVTLEGFVDTAEQKKEAEHIARDIDGVRSVVNRLTVGAPRR